MMMLVAGYLFMRVLVCVPVMLVLVMRVAMAVPVMLVMCVLDPRRDGYFRRWLRIEFLAQQQHHRGAEQREQRNEPDLIEKVHPITISINPPRRPARFPCCGTMRSECPGPPPLPPRHR